MNAYHIEYEVDNGHSTRVHKDVFCTHVNCVSDALLLYYEKLTEKLPKWLKIKNVSIYDANHQI